MSRDWRKASPRLGKGEWRRKQKLWVHSDGLAAAVCLCLSVVGSGRLRARRLFRSTKIGRNLRKMCRRSRRKHTNLNRRQYVPSGIISEQAKSSARLVSSGTRGSVWFWTLPLRAAPPLDQPCHNNGQRQVSSVNISSFERIDMGLGRVFTGGHRPRAGGRGPNGSLARNRRRSSR
jgi:hypothetical protein